MGGCVCITQGARGASGAQEAHRMRGKHKAKEEGGSAARHLDIQFPCAVVRLEAKIPGYYTELVNDDTPPKRTDDMPAIHCAPPVIERTVQIGGQTKAELLDRLAANGVELNEAAKILFASERFIISEKRRSLSTVEVSIRDLGFPQGATFSDICISARRLGFGLCPLEVGPQLRLQFLDQPEGFLGKPVYQHRAPPGSITVASEILSEHDDFPKGFYLRRINGTLWLRGYRAGLEHTWDAEDCFLFCKVQAA
jgi:hypothetical protein